MPESDIKYLLELARKKGSDEQFLKFISYQPSVIDGAWNQWDSEKGEGRNIACHVRRIKNGAGIGYKPSYSAVSMTDSQHKVQSSAAGEKGVLERWKSIFLTEEEAAIWFEIASERMLHEWIES